MGELHHLRGDPHEATMVLLPWYVTGAIEPGDRLLAETHLASCAECRAELAAERRLHAAFAALPPAPTQGWERFAADLGTPAPQRLPRRFAIRAGWMLGAQAALLLFGLGFVLHLQRQSPVPGAERYHALGSPEARPVGNLLVMFAPDTPEAAMREAIAASHARLVDGPTAAGAYLLATAPEQRAAALARLRAEPKVVLAQPVDPAP
ncbi:zf-HC2 domain-containing protein [uncultured Sphingomonas sp.]|uniref:zf-HC2 domain-containing protein n=1 Tax=uncultured Sphingomonas sp. TaxID=158754 RepID=UPI0025CC430D|nr:zf-HC2 domain-containing protein [uncultured Sphingomonas sp.]